MAFGDLLALVDRRGLPQFGRVVRYGSVEVTAIFDAEFQRADASQPGVATVGPAVFARLADLPADPTLTREVVVVDGVSYRVREAQKDGEGGVVLHLGMV